MAKRSLIRGLLLAMLLVSAAACASPTSSPPPGSPILPNLLIQVTGQVEVWRERGVGFVPAGLGTELRVGDMLRLSGGEAAVFCGNEALWDASPRALGRGKQGVPCLAGHEPRTTPHVSQLRGQGQAAIGEIPYILSPRSGFVSEERPTLRWHALAATEVYTLTLTSDDRVSRASVTIDDVPVTQRVIELAYPEAWLPLQAGGASYQVIVEGGGRISNEGDPPGQGFSLLEPADVAQLQQQIQRLRGRPVDEPALTLLLAELYLSHALRSEAAEMLGDLASGDEVAAAQLLLGETYLAMGLFSEAQVVQARALALAQEGGLPEAEAEARFGLGLAACGLWNASAAQAEWEQAQVQFKALGLVTEEAEVSGWLGEVAGRCSP